MKAQYIDLNTDNFIVILRNKYLSCLLDVRHKYASFHRRQSCTVKSIKGLSIVQRTYNKIKQITERESYSIILWIVKASHK
jgi:hypothetical protein